MGDLSRETWENNSRRTMVDSQKRRVRVYAHYAKSKKRDTDYRSLITDQRHTGHCHTDPLKKKKPPDNLERLS